MLRLVFALAAVAACTDFEPIDRDTCGNGLLEAGEDCDSSDARCVRCAVTCSTSADCPATHYTCGVDGVCHAPGGALGQPRAAGTFQADEVHVTDIDQDGVGDALGISRTSVIVRHGEATAQLDDIDSIVTPTQTGPAAFGDLDGDGSLDLTLTTEDGLVSYASPYGELAPVAVNGRLLDKTNNQPLDIRMLFYLAPNVFAGFIVDPQTEAVHVFALDGNAPPTTNPVFVRPCFTRNGVLRASDFDPKSVDVYRVHAPGQEQFDALISIVAGTGAARRFCVMSMHRAEPQFLQPFPAITVTDITPQSAGVPTKRVVLADLEGDSDPCPGLVKADAGVAQPMAYWDGSRPSDTGECTFALTSSQLPAIGGLPGAELVGRAPVTPRVLLVAADGLVTTGGVYPYLPNGIPFVAPSAMFIEVYKTTRKIVHLDVGDLDGDGNVDLVLAADGADDIDMLFRVPEEAGFNLVRLDTASTVTSITIGDYDGNRIADIAYTELLEDHERLMVSFGTPDRPLAPTSAGVFSGVNHVSRLGLPDSVDYLGLADDLAVLQPPPAGQQDGRMTLLHGSPQRTLLSYFDPRPEAARSDTLFRGSVIGHFATGTYADVVAIAPPSARANDSGAAVRAWRVPGTAEGLDGTATPGVEVQGVVDCSLGSASKLCLDVARYLAFPTGDEHDVVIGVDRGSRAVMVDPWSTANPVVATALDKLTAAIPANTVARSLHAADVDGDGVAELIAAFAPLAANAPGAVIVCAMTSGVPQSCDDVVPAIKTAATAGGITIDQCYDAAPARLSYRDPTSAPNASADLVVACRGDGTSVFRVRRDPAGDVIDRIATTTSPITALRGGDVTGDGVDDLVMLEGETVTSLVVYPQCTSRDLTCVAAGGDQ